MRSKFEILTGIIFEAYNNKHFLEEKKAVRACQASPVRKERMGRGRGAGEEA